MFKSLIILTLFTYSVDSYMAREFYEYKGQSGQVHRMPYRTMLLDWKEYIRKITQEYFLEIEEYGLCNFNFDDYTQHISRNFFGFDVKGYVNYTNGFIGTFQHVQIQDDKEMSWIDEATMMSYLKTKLIINDIMIYFDYEAILAHKNFGGTVAIPLASIEFEIKIIKSYKTNEINGLINDATVKYPKSGRWYYEPSNKYTDIFSRDVKWSFYDDLQKLSNTTMNILLNKVIKRYSYPDICFSCNEGMQLYEYKNIIKYKNN